MKKKRFKSQDEDPQPQPPPQPDRPVGSGKPSAAKEPITSTPSGASFSTAEPKSLPVSAPSARASRTVATSRFTDGEEPKVSRGAVPALMVALLVGLLFWGDMYVIENGGDLMGKSGSFPAQVYHPYRNFADVERMNPKPAGAEEFEKGRFVYLKACVACHQPNGAGVPGQFPPLVGSEWVLAEGPNRIIRIVLHGLQGPIEVKGQPFNNVMVPWKDVLNDEEVAAVLTFVRGEWGNKAGPVKPDQVKAIRDETKAKSDSWTAEALKSVAEK